MSAYWDAYNNAESARLAPVRQQDQQMMGALQQAAQFQTLQGTIQQQQARQTEFAAAQASKQALAQSGGDLNKAMEILIQSGNIKGAHDLAPLLKMKQEQELNKQFSGAMQQGGTPESLEAMATRLAASGHPGAASLSALADRRRVAQGQAAELSAMRSSPGKIIQPDPQEAEQSADQGTPVVPTVQTQGQGGIFSGLMESKYPAIAQQAKVLQDRLDKGAASGNLKYFEGQQAALAAREAQFAQADATLAAKQGDRIEIKNMFPPAASQRGSDNSGELTPEAIKDLAIQSLYDPKVLVGFNRDTRTRKLIQNEATRQATAAGASSNDIASGRAGFKADSASLSKLTQSYDAVTAFEKTAIRNGDRLLQLADKVDTTGVPVLEKWIRAGRQATGDADVAMLNAQMQVYRTEAARILTNPNLTGQLTDNARHEVEGFLSGNASAQQIRSVVGLLKNDFENRKVTLEDQIRATRNRMRGRQVGADSETDAPASAAPASAPADPLGIRR